MFAALVSKSGFLKRTLVPLGGHEQRSKLGIFIDEKGGPQVLRVFRRGPRLIKVLRTTVPSDTDKSC